MVWFLKRWNRVSEGLLDGEESPSSSSSSLPSLDEAGKAAAITKRQQRRDSRVLELGLERGDDFEFELLAPEEMVDGEEKEEELKFRGIWVGPEEAEEERRGYYDHHHHRRHHHHRHTIIIPLIASLLNVGRLLSTTPSSPPSHRCVFRRWQSNKKMNSRGRAIRIKNGMMMVAAMRRPNKRWRY
ncbi:hypothetical protein B0F90DRAFT_387384 [Multifurca ochricompacta]|uniref:Uncharacterized protein n=1 Tax=Multifurca ochricompacta TaxID=376703 RepID=A0AAD4LX94_9AGAM|nr:hypothetical protein B0F90DRAFT_387384 [Multifurca ochricompacta]